MQTISDAYFPASALAAAKKMSLQLVLAEIKWARVTQSLISLARGPAN